MLKEVKVKDFKGVPYLEGSQLMTNHQGHLRFSTKKPNVIVGPNGAGKSALLTALSIRFLTFFTGVSEFNDKYTSLERDSEPYWTRNAGWGYDYTYLPGLECQTDNAPALYYQPGHIPGNERCLTTSLMMGYSEEARAFARLTEKKSSGQATSAVLEKVLRALRGEEIPAGYSYAHWRFGMDPIDLATRRRNGGWIGDWDWQAEALKRAIIPAEGAQPLVMMDEPEQSLDARAEAALWKTILKADPRVQVIVATHSVFPILNPKGFNLIESEPGYAESVRDQYGAVL